MNNAKGKAIMDNEDPLQRWIDGTGSLTDAFDHYVHDNYIPEFPEPPPFQENVWIQRHNQTQTPFIPLGEHHEGSSSKPMQEPQILDSTMYHKLIMEEHVKASWDFICQLNEEDCIKPREEEVVKPRNRVLSDTIIPNRPYAYVSRRTHIELNGIKTDISGLPRPICSCTGQPQKCLRWGNGGWKSNCCTATMSRHPLPMIIKGGRGRKAGRTMNLGTFKRLVEKLISEDYDFKQPVDFKDHWVKHGGFKPSPKQR